MRYFLATLLVLTSTSALGVVSFGTAVNSGTGGVSVQAQPSFRTGIHATYLFVGQRPAITLDYQYFSNRLFQTRTRVYGGFGGDATIARDDKQDEVLSLRLPVGVQYDALTSSIQIFSEVAGVVGPLPTTYMSGQASLGLRAWF